MPGITPILGKHEKLTIVAFADEERHIPIGRFVAQFNPSSWSRSCEIEVGTETGAGNTTGPAQFKRFKAQDYTFELVFDGTGAASDDRADVADTVKTFLKICFEMSGDTHRPHYLKVLYGVLLIRCVLKSVTFNYTLFGPDGTPLRVKASAVFTGSVEDRLRVAKEDRHSPDLTRLHQVIQGESLPLLAWRFYGDAALYARVARFNELTDFRTVRAGQFLRFPPLKLLPA